MPANCVLLFLGAAMMAVAAVTPSGAQSLSSPQVLGRLTGPGSTPLPPGVGVYGNDLPWSFEHRGQVFLLFGDTWPHDHSVCEPEVLNDDTVATIPLATPDGVPPITFATQAGDPTASAPLTVRRDGASLTMGYGQVPLAGFSDGTDAFGVFGRFEYVRCTRKSARKRPTCRPQKGLECASDVGVCSPSLLRVPPLCDLGTGAGCALGGTCVPSGDGFCVDPTSSLADGSAGSNVRAVAHHQEVGVQDGEHPAEFASIGTIVTNKFINLSARTVRCFSGRTAGSDYGAGHGAVLMWGRPSFSAEKGRQANLYLMAHRLPFRRKGDKPVRFRPQYFAGTNPATGEPRWSARESDAVGLALDGVPNGSPVEDETVLMHMTFTWLGPPVNKWMMLSGGDLADYLLEDPVAANRGAAPGAIRARFADHPWGPWSPPVPHLAPGDPTVPGDLYGPGGWLFHPACEDQGATTCARSDPHRPADSALPGCPAVGVAFDSGRLYSPVVVDPYTRADGAGGLEVFWNVSTWNPYAVLFVKTTVTPGPVPAPSGGGRKGGFRWCER